MQSALVNFPVNKAQSTQLPCFFATLKFCQPEAIGSVTWKVNLHAGLANLSESCQSSTGTYNSTGLVEFFISSEFPTFAEMDVHAWVLELLSSFQVSCLHM